MGYGQLSAADRMCQVYVKCLIARVLYLIGGVLVVCTRWVPEIGELRLEDPGTWAYDIYPLELYISKLKE